MSIPETIITQRLILKPPEEKDAEQIARAANNLNVSKNLGTMPFPYELEDAKSWISRNQKDHGCDGYSFGIFDKARPIFMGTISIFNLMGGAPEYGFWLGEDFWDKGYISEATMALRDVVFAKLNAPFLLSKHMLDNPASGRIAEKCGLKEIERLPLWSRARGEYAPGRTLKLERVDWERLKGL